MMGPYLAEKDRLRPGEKRHSIMAGSRDCGRTDLCSVFGQSSGQSKIPVSRSAGL